VISRAPSDDREAWRIRSFVRREGRLTPGQQKALDTLWPHYGLDPEQPLDPLALFGRQAPLTLEIGFGNGASLAAMAARETENDFIGIEVHRPGVGRLLRRIEQQELGNVRLFCHDAVEVLNRCIGDRSLDRVLLFFPDPWPKTKHHKRRIVQPGFIRLLGRKIRPGGLLHLATDWQPYAEHMLNVMQDSPRFSNIAGQGQYAVRPAYRPATRFEQRGLRLGHTVRDLVFRRTALAE